MGDVVWDRKEAYLAYIKCNNTVLNLPTPDDDKVYCPRTFDMWGCWNDTPAGTTATIHCPPFVTGFNPELLATKECMSDGGWWTVPDSNKTWSDYRGCISQVTLERNTRSVQIYLAGYSLSAIAVTISLFIFTYFRNLSCARVTIHKNLFLSFLLNNVIWVIWYQTVSFSGITMLENPMWCRVLHVFTQLFLACNYLWMFCEGLYLHTLLVVAFVSETKLMVIVYLIGWGLPALFTLLYGLLRGFLHEPSENMLCWSEVTDITWVIGGPCVASLIINFIFLINIVRVLVTKLRAPNVAASSQEEQAKKAVRATLVLIPLFGIQYFLMPFRPDGGEDGDSTGSLIYDYAAAVFTSFQGLFVAIFFCFLNGEVISSIRRKFQDAGIISPPRYSGYAMTTMTERGSIDRHNGDSANHVERQHPECKCCNWF